MRIINKINKIYEDFDNELARVKELMQISSELGAKRKLLVHADMKDEIKKIDVELEKVSSEVEQIFSKINGTSPTRRV